MSENNVVWRGDWWMMNGKELRNVSRSHCRCAGVFSYNSWRKLRKPSFRVSAPCWDSSRLPLQYKGGVLLLGQTVLYEIAFFFLSLHWYKQFVMIENATFVYSLKCQYCKTTLFSLILLRNNRYRNWLQAGRINDRFSSHERVKNFVSFCSPDRLWRTSSLLSSGYRGFPPGRKADHSPPTSVEVKETWN
jgi:hypothetical protein